MSDCYPRARFGARQKWAERSLVDLELSSEEEGKHCPTVSSQVHGNRWPDGPSTQTTPQGCDRHDDGTEKE
jgi:hypothetical protein